MWWLACKKQLHNKNNYNNSNILNKYIKINTLPGIPCCSSDASTMAAGDPRVFEAERNLVGAAVGPYGKD